MPIAQIGSNLDLFHVDKAMSNAAFGYAQEATDFIGDQVAPILTVDKRSDAFWKGRTEHMQLHNTLRQNRSAFARGDREFNVDTFYCKQYGWEEQLDWADPLNQDEALDIENEQVTTCVDVLQLDYERRVSETAQDTGQFGSTGLSKSLLASDCDPLQDFLNAKLEIRGKTGHVPNTVIFNYAAIEQFKLLDAIVQRIKYVGDQQEGVITEAQVAQLLGVDRILVGKAVYDSTPPAPGEPAHPTFVDLWDPNKIIVAYIDPRIAPLRGKVICPMRTIVWNKLGGRFATRTYEQDETTSTVVQCIDFTDEKVVIADAAYILTGAMASPSSSPAPSAKARKPVVTPPDEDEAEKVAA